MPSVSWWTAAQEVAQTVFIALAQQAQRIPEQTVLYGWLFRANRYAALHLVRARSPAGAAMKRKLPL